MSILLILYYYITALYNIVSFTIYNVNIESYEHNFYKPTQIHISYYDTLKPSYTVSWHTEKECSDCYLEYGIASGNYSTKLFTNQKSYFEEYEHHVVMDNLTFDTLYYYRINNKHNSSSNEFWFRTIKQNIEELNVVLFGDMDYSINSLHTYYMLTNWSISNKFDFILHLGDIAYADNDFLLDPFTFGYENRWNNFMSKIESYSAYKPYMVAVGNHESECHSIICIFSKEKYNKLSNYTAYNNRFNMPNNGKLNMWYSFTLGKAYFIQISTETDYPNAPTNTWNSKNTSGYFGNQLKWLENELIKANNQRTITPWIVINSHRPIYSNRYLIDLNIKNAFEPLFYKYKVDIIFSGHVHHYERHYPIYNNSFESSYINPTYPIYITSGAAGSIEGLYINMPYLVPKWNAFYSDKYGVGILTITNNSLVWSFYDSRTGGIIDTIDIVKYTIN